MLLPPHLSSFKRSCAPPRNSRPRHCLWSWIGLRREGEVLASAFLERPKDTSRLLVTFFESGLAITLLWQGQPTPACSYISPSLLIGVQVPRLAFEPILFGTARRLARCSHTLLVTLDVISDLDSQP